MSQSTRALTSRQRVLRRYRSAKAVKSKNGWCIHRNPSGRGIVRPLDNCWMPTEAAAWDRAEWRLHV